MQTRISMALVLLAAACDGGVDLSSEGAALGKTPGFEQPPGTVAVSFSVDDRANRVYRDGDLVWKGSFLYDPVTRTLVHDPSWSGGLAGWPPPHDDGPWTKGGHEPIGARKNDHVWGVTVFVQPPASGAQIYEYGLIDALYETTFGNGWIWRGPNGAFQVAAGDTAAVEAAGATLPAFGDVDLELRLDTSALAPHDPAWDTSTVRAKSSAWGWGELDMVPDGAGGYSLALSSVVGRKGLLPHTGLLNGGDLVDFVFVLGGVEYMGTVTLPDGTLTFGALSDGVGAGARGPHDKQFTPLTVEFAADRGNTFVVIP